MQNENCIINIVDGVVRDVSVQFSAQLNLSIQKKENIAIVGDNGSGKTVLVDTITGRYPLCSGAIHYDFSPSSTDAVYKNIRTISFRDVYGSSVADYCYQLRWNVHEQDDVPTVRDVIGDNLQALCETGVFKLFALEQILDEKVVALSSGEMRKLQIALALSDGPRVLIVDNLFIGLDVSSRKMIDDLLCRLTADDLLQFIFVTTSCSEIPRCVDSVVVVKDKSIIGKYSRENYFTHTQNSDSAFDNISHEIIAEKQNAVLALPQKDDAYSYDEVLSMNNVSVVYGKRVILKDFSWKVCSGQVWALEGPNGSGKSTLLSLICADNLQSYACDMYLFGRKRGSGESIWDIKKRIGYVSPEMHRSYLRNISVGDVVASGLFDSIGLYRRATDEQREQCRFWVDLFGISNIVDKSFLRISGGEQRLALLARAFVKDPDLLILDEPFHGLDPNNKKIAKAIVEAFSQRKGKTVLFVSHYKEELPSTVTNNMLLARNK